MYEDSILGWLRVRTNSGHYRIEAIPQMSQYRAQLAAILDKIGPWTSLTPWVSSAIMVNILGEALLESWKRHLCP
jgi:phosphoribosylaminoimidazole carboxylase (NCAIR synthetase)